MSYSTYMNVSVAASVVGMNVAVCSVCFGDKRVICGESVYNTISIFAPSRCLTFKSLICLNRGSVCALYLLTFSNRIVLF